MNQIVIRKLNKNESIPYDLLLLADPSLEVINEYISRGLCFVAGNEDEIIGVYVLIKTRPQTMELVNIAVNEKYQGQGIGKKLVLDSIDRARKEKVKVLEVGTGNSSISQLALYQKCGFRITAVDRDFFKIHYDEDIFENGIQCIDMIRLSMKL